MRIDAPKIKSWVERIEALLAERAGINGDIRDIYAEVKSHEHDGKAIRKLIQRRAQDAGDLAAQDALLAAYTDAIAGKIRALEAIDAGASTEEAAKAGGISTGAVSALRQGRPHVQKSRKLNDTPHDPATGEIINHPSAGVEPQAVGAAERAPLGNDAAGSSAVTTSTSKETDDGRDRHGEGRRTEGFQSERLAGGGGHQEADSRTDRDHGGHSRSGRREGRPGGGSGHHEHPDRQHVVRSSGDQGPVATTPAPTDIDESQPDATPAGAVVAVTSGVTAGETAPDIDESSEAGPATGPLEVDHGARQLTPPGPLDTRSLQPPHIPDDVALERMEEAGAAWRESLLRRATA